MLDAVLTGGGVGDEGGTPVAESAARAGQGKDGLPEVVGDLNGAGHDRAGGDGNVIHEPAHPGRCIEREQEVIPDEYTTLPRYGERSSCISSQPPEKSSGI